MSLFTPNTPFFTNYYDKGRYIMTWRISLLFVIIFAVLSVLFSFTNPISFAIAIITFGISVSSFIFLNLTKKFTILFWIYAVTGSVVANFAINTVQGPSHFVDFIWMFVCVFLAFIGLGRKAGLLILCFNMFGIIYFMFFSLNDHILGLSTKSSIEIIGEVTELLFSVFVFGYLIFQFISFQTYSEKQLSIANQELANKNTLILSKNNENETLLKEIHHRVKNNLQIVISLLRMQSMEMKSDESKTHFSEAINRIMAMSLIHQKLYGTNELSKVDIKTYINELVTDIISVSLGDNEVSLEVNAEVNELNLDTIVPLGLLVNELVSNSLKHAFNDANGNISIEINQDGDNIEFDYSDNGAWKEPVEGRISFGVELIEILTDQMNGSKVLNVENGAHYTFKLKNI